MNAIRAAIDASRPSLGVWSNTGSPVLAELAAASGVDWVLLDTQHGALAEATMLATIQAVELGGATALVRVGANDPRLIMRAVDLGATGVVPLVSSAQQLGGRGRRRAAVPGHDRDGGRPGRGRGDHRGSRAGWRLRGPDGPLAPPPTPPPAAGRSTVEELPDQARCRLPSAARCWHRPNTPAEGR